MALECIDVYVPFETVCGGERMYGVNIFRLNFNVPEGEPWVKQTFAWIMKNLLHLFEKKLTTKDNKR